MSNTTFENCTSGKAFNILNFPFKNQAVLHDFISKTFLILCKIHLLVLYSCENLYLRYQYCFMYYNSNPYIEINIF